MYNQECHRDPIRFVSFHIPLVRAVLRWRSAIDSKGYLVPLQKSVEAKGERKPVLEWR